MCNKSRITKRGLAFAEILVAERDRMNGFLFRRACDANQIAKLCKGQQQSKAYAIKNACIRQLINRGHIAIGIDTWCCPGLLSVGVDGRRLHTHENWLHRQACESRTAGCALG